MCCNYFLIEVLSGSKWVALSFTSKSLAEVNSWYQQYSKDNGYKPYRIVQRSIEADRKKGYRVPRCC